jgi:O-antigen ligase
VVVIADSRTGFIAVLAPLVFLLVVRLLRGLRTSGVPHWLTRGVLTAIAAASFLVVLRLDPSLNVRIESWNQFLDLWQKNWLFGAGQTGIQEVANSGDLPSWANHGHNLVIDVLGRFGLVGGIALLSTLTSLTLLVWFDAKSCQGAALSIMVMFVAAGVIEDLIDWRYLGMHYVPLLLCSMLVAQGSLSQKVQR